MQALLLRLEADVMSFGGPRLDRHASTRWWPTRSMLTGFIGNAMGLDVAVDRDRETLHSLQAQMKYGVRCDRKGKIFGDLKSIDFSQARLQQHTTMLTPHGWVHALGRTQKNKQKTYLGSRQLIAGASYLAVVSLTEGPVSLQAIAAALEAPKRHLHVGMGSNFITRPPFEGILETETILGALESTLSERQSQVPAVWPEDEGHNRSSEVHPIIEDRDWTNDIIVGYRLIRQGLLRPN